MLLPFLFCGNSLLGQNKNEDNYKSFITKSVKFTSDTIRFDTLSIVPGSFSIKDLNKDQYYLDEIRAELTFKPSSLTNSDNFLITYRRLPIKLDSVYSHKNIDQIEQHVAVGGSYNYNAQSVNNPSGKLIDFNTMDYSGSFARSIAAGNNQNISMNSQFNLQLNGYLLDSIKVEAAISDNNIPFQPEGNTQRLQEFDQVYITFEKKLHQLTLGDFKLEKPNNYFLNYNKRVQGLRYLGSFGKEEKINNKVAFSGSMAKGQFTRNIFNGIEGNQGPYKLQGENGEQYFIILAGSERVYIDGELLVRGEDKDYIIDYNMAELIFMPRRLITKEKRIQIEFEYQARNYLNSLFHIADELSINKKFKFRFNLYANQDAKNSNFNQTLSDEQKIFLATIGDNTDQAFYDNVRIDTFGANKILYKKIDSLVNGILYSDIYVYSTDSSLAKYSPGFSYMGEGKGNYQISDLNTNGRSYQWIAPINGIAQGNYDPIVLLITPKKLRVLSAGGTYLIDSNQKIDIEWAGSEYDPNTFSKLDNDKHWGNALRMNYELAKVLTKDSLNMPILKWQNKLSYEFVDNRFEAIAPFRNVEFSRDWNINNNEKRSNEHIIDFTTGLTSLQERKVLYNFTFYKRGVGYSGNRHLIDANWDKGLMKIKTFSSVLISQSLLYNSTFLRPNLTFEHFLSKKKQSLLGVHFEKEYNYISFNQSDSLDFNSFDFDVSKLYFKMQRDKQVNFDFSYQFRRDFNPIGKKFKLQDIAQTFEANISINSWKNHNLSFNGSYRTLSLKRPSTNNLKDENTLLGRINYKGNVLNGFFTSNLLYDFGTGQEQKRQFTFIEVPTGQGTHMWIDYNKDGIQQVNEFVLAVYPDQKRFVKMITPTNEYVKVNFANFNLSAQLNPENLWKHTEEQTFMQMFTSKFSDQFSMQANNRILKDAGYKAFNPLAFHFIDTTVVSSLMSMLNTVYFNRKNTKWGIDYSTNLNRIQALLTYGVETQISTFHLKKIRWVLNKNFTFFLNGSQGKRSFESPISDGRTYLISYSSIEPNLNFISAGSWRINGSYRFEQRRNATIWGGELALVNRFSVETKWNMPIKGNISAGLSLNNIEFNSQDNSPVGIVMLESLTKGNNWIWNLNWTTRLSKTIELSIDYNGRALGNTNTIYTNSRTIHNGNMSLRAIL
ncbi:MAG TPA: hypothetical protein VLZ83_15475 [Edaphocola sp.]|nr:hypothetical protein [Edaphocola sp.]